MIGRAVCAMLLTGSAALGGGFDRAVEALGPRVVKLYGLKTGQQVGYGTGVLVSADGLILTVYSLLIDARHVRAVTADGTSFEAEVVRRDPQRQLALLRIQSPPGAASLALPYFDLQCSGSDSASSKPGDWVVIAGNPFKLADGAEPVTYLHGVISARTRMDARRNVKEFPYRGDVLVLDAVTSNPGHPGSGVVDIEGRFVGMVGREVVSNLTHTQFNYAMPRDVICEFMAEFNSGAETPSAAASTKEAPVIDPGIRLVKAGYRKVPPVVDRVRRGSPAERAGVRQNDVILSMNGKGVGDGEEYESRLRLLPPGELIDLVLRRGRDVVSLRLEPEKPQ